MPYNTQFKSICHFAAGGKGKFVHIDDHYPPARTKPKPFPEHVVGYIDDPVVVNPDGSVELPSKVLTIRLPPPVHATDDTAAINLLGDVLAKRFEDTINKRVDSVLGDVEKRVQEAIKDIPPTVLNIEVKQPTGETITIDGAHHQLPTLIALAQRRKNIYLWDATGGGKSYAVAQLAKALGLRYACQSFNGQSPDYLVLGYMDANGKYVPSIYYDYYKNGGLYGGEELDDGSADLLVTFNVSIANSHMTFPNGETVQRHQDFIFVGCGNTAGRGANPRYPERKPFDAAFANRFFFLRWEYDTILEERIATAINPNSTIYVKWVHKSRQIVQDLGLRLEITPRTSYFLAELSLDKGITDDQLLDGVLAGIDETSKQKLIANNPFPVRG